MLVDKIKTINELIEKINGYYDSNKQLDNEFKDNVSKINSDYNNQQQELDKELNNYKKELKDNNKNVENTYNQKVDVIKKIFNQTIANIKVKQNLSYNFKKEYIDQLINDTDALENIEHQYSQVAASLADDSLLNKVGILFRKDNYSKNDLINTFASDYVLLNKIYQEVKDRDIKLNNDNYLVKEQDFKNRAELLVKNFENLRIKELDNHNQDLSASKEKIIQEISNYKEFFNTINKERENINLDCDKQLNVDNHLYLGNLSYKCDYDDDIKLALSRVAQQSYEHGTLLVPISTDLKNTFYYEFDSINDNTIYDGINNFLFSILKFIPKNKYHIDILDFDNAGKNFPLLSGLTYYKEVNNISIYTLKEDIAQRLREIQIYSDNVARKALTLDDNTGITNSILVINDICSMTNDMWSMMNNIVKNSVNADISIIAIKSKQGNDYSKYEDIKKTWQEYFIKFEYNNYYYFNYADNLLKLSLTKKYDKDSELVKKYQESFLKVDVDNYYTFHFDILNFNGFNKQAYDYVEVPLGIDENSNIFNLRLGKENCPHALLSGATGSGKTTTLFTIIYGVMANYHPDDVELWLVDFKKTGFTRFQTINAPHIKSVITHNAKETILSFLDKLYDEYNRRKTLFAQKAKEGILINDISDYKRQYGLLSLPRIVVIVDEFHIMTQAISDDNQYRLKLTNILRESRSFGISLLFSDQSASNGLNGLNDDGKAQLTVRMAMSNAADINDIRQTLSLPFDKVNSIDLSSLQTGDLLINQSLQSKFGSTVNELSKYKVLYIRDNEQVLLLSAINDYLKDYHKQDVIMVSENNTGRVDEQQLENYYQIINLKSNEILVPLGKPLTLDDIFAIKLKRMINNNILIASDNEEIASNIVISFIKAFDRIGFNIVLLSDDTWGDDGFGNEIERINITENSGAIITWQKGSDKVSKTVLETLYKDSNEKTLFIWVSINSLYSQFDYGIKYDPNKNKTNSSYDDLGAEVFAMMQQLHPDDNQQDEIIDGQTYDITNQIIDLLRNGYKKNIYNLFLFDSVGDLTDLNNLDSRFFIHRISTRIASNEVYDFYGQSIYDVVNNVADNQAIYSDTRSNNHIFTPFDYNQED